MYLFLPTDPKCQCTITDEKNCEWVIFMKNHDNGYDVLCPDPQMP